MPPPDDKDRVRRGNGHYIIAAILCVTGFVLMLTVAGAAVGLPMLLIGFVWFAVARWAKSHHFANR